jgi:hypothetical protein
MTIWRSERPVLEVQEGAEGEIEIDGLEMIQERTFILRIRERHIAEIE